MKRRSRLYIHCMAILLLASFASASAASTLLARTNHFELHADELLNLHHLLYHWARAEEGIGSGRMQVTVAERGDWSALSAGEQARWQEAVEFYRENVAELSHLSDAMLFQKVAILKAAGDPVEVDDKSIPGIRVALERALPVYKVHWWPEHDRVNRRWADEVVAHLADTEADFVDLTTRIYDARWPAEPLRVDLSYYANFRAGYTGLSHVVMYTGDPGNQGLYGFEMLLHESQHTRYVASAVRRAIRRQFSEAGKEVPPNLWHALLFITSGDFAERIAAASCTQHISYWEREGFREFGGWATAIRLAEDYWRPVINGEATTEEALQAFVEAE